MARRLAWLVPLVITGCGLETGGLASDEVFGPSDAFVADTFDAGASVDTGSRDTGAVDTSLADTGLADTGLVDTGPADTGPADTGLVDTGVADTWVPPPFCDATDTTLIACYRFNGDGSDESANKNDLTTTGVTWVTGVAGRALSLGMGSKVTAPDTPSFAVTNTLTIELWVRPRTLPASGRMGLIDDDGRFGLFIYPPGVVRATSPSQLDTPAPLAALVWTHVAFTYDGATMTLYVNGASVATKAVTATFGTPSGNGVAVGMNSPSGDILDGEIDGLRVFRVARTARQVCQAAGTC